jgi:hypothetical protein
MKFASGLEKKKEFYLRSTIYEVRFTIYEVRIDDA